MSHYVGPYNQYFQEVLNPDSGLRQFAPDILFVSLSLRMLSPAVHSAFLGMSQGQREQEVERLLAHMEDVASAAKQSMDATILMGNFPMPPRRQAGIADANMEYGEAEFYASLNLGVLRAFKHDPRVQVFDIERVLSAYGKRNAHEPRMYYLAKMEWTEGACKEIAAEMTRYLAAITGKTKKCLVLDLDNTLWGGVLGEEGPEGVKVGQGDPEAEAYLEFQQVVRALKDRGTLLAICSKNNPEDVQEAFSLRTDMPLKLDDFVAQKINWERKSTNIAAIAEALNIGVDSLVFVDDNPAECEEIRQLLPEVRTVELPKDSAQFADLLRGLPDFEKTTLTEDDSGKTDQYRQRAKREEHRQQVGDINTYLESLGTRVSIFPAEPSHVERAHQLFSKTNQFNATTKRYGAAEVQGFIDASDWELGLARVSDAFGDMGIVGLYLLRRGESAAFLDSLILSCRAMGRGVETAIMNFLKRRYLLSGEYAALEAEFAPTQKNAPIEEFYESQGFEVTERSAEGGKRYRLDHSVARVLECVGINIG